MKGTENNGLKYYYLGKSTLRFFGISNVCFENIEDLSFQLGHIIIPTDDSRRKNTLPLVSFESKWVLQFVLRAEAYAFADLFEEGFSIINELTRTLKIRMAIIMFTEWACLMHLIIRLSKDLGKESNNRYSTKRAMYTTNRRLTTLHGSRLMT